MAFCSNCGAQVTDAEKFCGECGYPTGKTAASAQAVQPPQQAVCPNCGTLYSEAEKFCGECGLPKGQPAPAQAAQPQQQAVAPAPPPVQQPHATADKGKVKKKKSKAPFFIGGGVVIVAALAAAVYFTNGFGLFGGGGDKPNGGDVPSDVAVDIPKDATDEEKLAYIYADGFLSIFNDGNKYYEDGILPAANYNYGIAASSISSLRYAVDCLLEAKGTAPPGDDRLRDWDVIAALSWASHYPYVFEGIVLEARGDKNAAMSCYEKAALNPLISEDDADLRYITRLNADQLQRLLGALTKAEDQIFEVYHPMSANIPRDEHNFDEVYLRGQGNAAIETDYATAKQYFYAAVSVDPFNGNNHAGLVVLCLEMDDVSAAIRWLNDGLFVDPDNETLNSLYEAMKGVLEQ